jgi:long-chain acyl-CoA synthetase
MAAVIGLPRDDDETNEYVKAYLVLKEGVEATPEEFIAWAKDNMAGYKRPREVVFVKELPMTAVGKVLRRELKEAELAKKK